MTSSSRVYQPLLANQKPKVSGSSAPKPLCSAIFPRCCPRSRRQGRRDKKIRKAFDDHDICVRSSSIRYGSDSDQGLERGGPCVRGVIEFPECGVDRFEPRRLRTRARQGMQEGLRGYIENLEHIQVDILFKLSYFAIVYDQITASYTPVCLPAFSPPRPSVLLC